MFGCPNDSMKPLRRRLEGALGAFAFARIRNWLLRKTPERAEEAGARLGRWVFCLSRKHRERALANLAMAFPDQTAQDRLALAERVFEHYGRVTADFLVSSARTSDDLERSMEIVGRENLDRALEAGKGALLVTGHFGNWERLSAWLSTHGYPLSVVARDASNPRLNELVNQLRSGTGTRVIARGDAARPILQRLRNNELVGILPDQNADEVFVPFFGQPCGTVLGPGVLSERTGAPVVPCWCVRIGPVRYRMIFEPALQAQPGYETKGEGMIRSINASLEAIVRQYPEQWLWFHDRWRSARRKGLLRHESSQPSG